MKIDISLILRTYREKPSAISSTVIKELIKCFPTMTKTSKLMEVKYNGYSFTVTVTKGKNINSNQFKKGNDGIIAFAPNYFAIYFIDVKHLTFSQHPTKIDEDGNEFYKVSGNFKYAEKDFNTEKYSTQKQETKIDNASQFEFDDDIFMPTMFTYDDLLKIKNSPDDNQVKLFLQNSIGAYLLMCKKTNAQYVGAVYKEGGFLGRWAGGHLLKGGDAVFLKEHIQRHGWGNMIFCIERIAKDKRSALDAEKHFKEIYQTRNRTKKYYEDVLKLNAN